MSMNDYNASIANRVIESIQRFEAGDVTLDEIQADLQAALPLFENDGSGAAESVRLAEADLEGIQFTVLLDEQRPAAIFRLDELLAALEVARDG
ncbi:MAG: hypothetical protein JWR83_3568 [Aeromicrobium sp.]|nr:hypothetical protein [Aeromicrobium sp.]